MTASPLARGFAIGFVVSTLAGVGSRSLEVVSIGYGIAGLAVGVVAPSRLGFVGLVVGQVASFVAIATLQFLTPIGTVINSESIDELLGFAPLVALIWAGFVGSGVIGWAIAAYAIRRRMRSGDGAG